MNDKRYIVKPIYFRLVHNGHTEIRLFQIYDTHHPFTNGSEMIPNFNLKADSWGAVEKWFIVQHINGGEWKMIIPTFAHVDEFDAYVDMDDVIEI